MLSGVTLPITSSLNFQSLRETTPSAMKVLVTKGTWFFITCSVFKSTYKIFNVFEILNTVLVSSKWIFCPKLLYTSVLLTWCVHDFKTVSDRVDVLTFQGDLRKVEHSCSKQVL